jgi:hypothetical protein
MWLKVHCKDEWLNSHPPAGISCESPEILVTHRFSARLAEISATAEAMRRRLPGIPTFPESRERLPISSAREQRKRRRRSV